MSSRGRKGGLRIDRKEMMEKIDLSDKRVDAYEHWSEDYKSRTGKEPSQRLLAEESGLTETEIGSWLHCTRGLGVMRSERLGRILGVCPTCLSVINGKEVE